MSAAASPTLQKTNYVPPGYETRIQASTAIDRFAACFCSRSEVAVLRWIAERTLAYGKQWDRASYSQMTYGAYARGELIRGGTGLSERGNKEAVKSLVAKGLLLVDRQVDEKQAARPNLYAIDYAVLNRLIEQEKKGFKSKPARRLTKDSGAPVAPEGGAEFAPGGRAEFAPGVVLDLHHNRGNLNRGNHHQRKTTGPFVSFSGVGEVQKRCEPSTDPGNFSENPKPEEAMDSKAHDEKPNPREPGKTPGQERPARVTVSPRAASVPFPEVSKPSPSDSEKRRQPIPDSEQEMKLRLQQRHPAKWIECLAFVEKDMLRLAWNWTEVVAIDDRCTTNPAGLTNPIGYYRDLFRREKREAVAAIRERARVPTAVKETAPCAKCARSGMLASGEFCDCTMGRDLAQQAKWKKAKQPQQSSRRLHRADDEQRGQAQQTFPAYRFYEALHVSEKRAGWTVDAAAEWLAARTPWVKSSAELLLDYGAFRRAYRYTASALHPDHGGSAELFMELGEVERVLEQHHGKNATRYTVASRSG